MSHTRRGLLAGGASLVLAGCGASPEADDGSPGQSETGRRADAEVLDAALEVKAATLAAYGEHDLAGIERAHVARLKEEIIALGATPSSGGGFAVGDPLAGEEASIAAIQDLLPKLSDRDLRSLLARMMVVDAEQLAALRERPAADALLAPGGPA